MEHGNHRDAAESRLVDGWLHGCPFLTGGNDKRTFRHIGVGLRPTVGSIPITGPTFLQQPLPRSLEQEQIASVLTEVLRRLNLSAENSVRFFVGCVPQCAQSSTMTNRLLVLVEEIGLNVATGNVRGRQ